MDDEIRARITQVQARYADQLMAMAHVVGLGVGVLQKGPQAGKPGLVVLVSQIADNDDIPDELDGIPLEIREAGEFTAQ